MATGTYEGDVYALQDAKTIGSFPNARLAGGNLYCSVDRVVAATGDGLTLGSTFKVGKLPKGAVVQYSIIYPIATVTFDAPDTLTGATLFVLGIAGDTDLFGALTTTFASSAIPQIVLPVPDGTTYTDRLDPLEEAVDVIATSSAVNHTTAEGICVMIFYTM